MREARAMIYLGKKEIRFCWVYPRPGNWSDFMGKKTR